MRKKEFTAFLTAALMAAVTVSGCSQTSQSGIGETSAAAEAASEAVPVIDAVDIADGDALLIGGEGLSGVFNPLFANQEADLMVCDLVFDTICSINDLGELEDAAGHLELLSEDESAGDGTEGTFSDDSMGETNSGENSKEEDPAINYRLTLNKGMKFSDGSDVTIDDVIFTWKLMADSYYEGSYSLAEIPVLGMQEYYYDTEDVAAYKKQIKNYSGKDISEEDFIAYLIDTKLNGWFDGNLPGNLDGKGTTWVDYLEGNGYSTAGIEDNAEELLKVLAKCEYEHYAFSYDPSSYYQEKGHEDVLSGGVQVSEIEGIQRIDDYSCVIRFTSVDAEALRAMTVIPILSEAYYGPGYEKGGIENLKKFNGVPMGSGCFAFNSYSEDTVSLIASDSSRVKSASRYVKIKNIAKEEQAQALKKGTIALASLKINSSPDVSDNNNLEVIPVGGSGFYYFGINTDMVNRLGIRKGIMALIDKSLLYASDEQISDILTSSQAAEGESKEGEAVSADRVSDLVSLTPQTWPATRLSIHYPGIKSLLESGALPDSEDLENTDMAEKDVYEYSLDTARSEFGSEGYWNDGTVLVRNGEQLKLNMGISEELPDHIKAVAYQLKDDLDELGASVVLKEYSEENMKATIPTAAFDLWIGAFTDLPDYDMEEYLCYGAENNCFHCQNGYADLLFEEAREAEDDSRRTEIVKEMLVDIMEGAYCRPLCQEISEAYVVDTSAVDLTNRKTYLNEYDSFSEVISGIGLK